MFRTICPDVSSMGDTCREFQRQGKSWPYQSVFIDRRRLSKGHEAQRGMEGSGVPGIGWAVSMSDQRHL